MPQITNSFPFQFYGTTIEVHMVDDGRRIHLIQQQTYPRKNIIMQATIGDKANASDPITYDTAVCVLFMVTSIPSFEF
jgi:hypothetical protein